MKTVFIGREKMTLYDELMEGMKAAEDYLQGKITLRTVQREQAAPVLPKPKTPTASKISRIAGVSCPIKTR